jgi:hypothetical protein
VALQHRAAGEIGHAGLERPSQPGVEIAHRQRRAAPFQVEHRARPVLLAQHHAEVARQPGLGDVLGQRRQQRHHLETVHAQDQVGAFGLHRQPCRLDPGAQAVHQIGAAGLAQRAPVGPPGIIALTQLGDRRSERAHLLQHRRVQIVRAGHVGFLRQHADHRLQVGRRAAHPVEYLGQQRLAAGMGGKIGSHVAQRQHVARGQIRIAPAQHAHPPGQHLRRAGGGAQQVRDDIGVAGVGQTPIGVSHRPFAQIVEQVARQPRRLAGAEHVGRLTVVEDDFMLAAAKQHAHRHIGQKRLQPRLLGRKPGGLARHRIGQRGAGLGQLAGRRRAAGARSPR